MLCLCLKNLPTTQIGTYIYDHCLHLADQPTARGEILPKTIFDLFFPPRQADITAPGFQEYHERLQTFLMWFIETASFIDSDDDRWDFFLV